MMGIKPIYVGETGDEYTRIHQYAQNNSHLGGCIRRHVSSFGVELYYRSQRLATKAAAKEMQDNLLRKFDYECNKQQN